MACQFEYNGEWYSEEELKAVFNNPQKPSTVINASLKATNVLFSNKANDFFKAVERNKLSGDVFWKKMQSDLSIPKEQIDILKSFGTEKKDELITNLLANYSYTIEINTAKTYNEPYNSNSNETKEQFVERTGFPTSHYSNLTVPGGTNYTEQEISTPLITPSIKGHAQFATDNGIGWFRSDDKSLDRFYDLPEGYKQKLNLITISKENGKYYETHETQGKREISKENALGFVNMLQQDNLSDSKTRRILEVQSDWGQKQRKSSEPDINVKYDIQQIINDLQKSGDLKIDCN